MGIFEIAAPAICLRLQKILYVYDFMTELCIRQGEIVPNHGMSAAQGKVERNTEIVSRLNVPAIRLTTLQVTRLPLWRKLTYGVISYSNPGLIDVFHLYLFAQCGYCKYCAFC